MKRQMHNRTFVRSLIAAVLCAAPANAVQPVIKDTGSERFMLVEGTVVGTDGQPAEDVELIAYQKTRASCESLRTSLQRSKFKLWVPIHWSEWFYVELSARANDGKQRAFRGIANRDLRQAAVDGVVLHLADAERQVIVTVTKDKKPVPGAHVTARTRSNALLHGDTDEEGNVTFGLLPEERLGYLNAWTDDYLIGGYSFSRKPRRDPLSTEHTIELEDCRDQVIRFLHVDDDSPVGDVKFNLTVGTGYPNYNFPAVPGMFMSCTMTTNQQGEATFRWFPDWEKHGSYVEIIDPRWAKAFKELATAEDGALVMKLKPRVERKTLVGRVTSKNHDVGGLLIEIRSFQGEEENYSDHRYALTNADGSFSAPCIPGATYCVFVNDPQLTSEMIDLIPYEPDTDKTNDAELTVTEGRPVEVRVTSGTNREPMRGEWVYIRQEHDYSWYEDGEQHYGSGCRDRGVYTDDHGVARVLALAGANLEISVNAGEWRSEHKDVEVKREGITTVDFHRVIDEERTVTGRLVAPTNMEVDLTDAEVYYGSIDGETDEEEKTTTDAQGRFEFDSRAIRLGILVYTADGKAAGIARPIKLDGPIKLKLKATCDLRGQLLGKNDEPAVDHAVRVTPRVIGKSDLSSSFSTDLHTKTFETRTDSEGYYTLKNLPAELALRLRADPIDGSDYDAYLDRFFLKAGEERPLMVSRLERRRESDTRTLAEKYEAQLRDARINGYHLLVMVFNTASDDFVGRNLTDPEKINETMRFMHLRIHESDVEDQAAQEYVDSKGWPQPDLGKVFVCALDGAEKEIGRVVLDTRADGVIKEAAEFVRKHAPLQHDAQEEWEAAFAEAQRTDRKVWARVSGRYCGPCFMLSRWLDENRELLEKDYIFLKIDNAQDKHGGDVSKRLVGDRKDLGIPFHAVFDANEKLLIDSDGPTGNIGYPGSLDGRLHLKNMLLETRDNLTDAEIEEIVSTLE